MKNHTALTYFFRWVSTLFILSFSSIVLADSVDLTSTQTSLNGCEKKESHDFKREKQILEKCPSKADFHVFIQGETEDTLKFSLEQEIAKPLIWDDPYAQIIKIRDKHDAESKLNGEITGSYINWSITKDNKVAGVVLRRLQNKAKTFEAFRFMDQGYFCHIGGNPDHNEALELIKADKACL